MSLHFPFALFLGGLSLHLNMVWNIFMLIESTRCLDANFGNVIIFNNGQIKKFEQLDYEWSSEIKALCMMRFIHDEINFGLYMIVIKTTQNVHKLCFQAILMTFTCDLKIDLIVFEPHHVKLFFL